MSEGMGTHKVPDWARWDHPVQVQLREQEKVIAKLTAENERLQQHISALEGGAHTCHANCPRPMCVMRRELDALKSENERLRERSNCLLISLNAIDEISRNTLMLLRDMQEDG